MTRTYWAAVTAVVLALLFAAGAVTVAAGNGNEDGGRGGSPASRTPAEDSADAGFARDMSVHHQQAVEMSFIVRDRTKNEEVRRLAYDIANTQANQRGMMLGWLDLWGLPKVSAGEPMAWMTKPGSDGGHGGHGSHGTHEVRDGSLMPGMATRTDLAKLRAADGRQAEILYLRLMTAHHKGGVTMAQGCADRCEVAVERSLAQGMVDAQESEIALMADLLKARGAAPRP
ncbi:DUF305 domain-containing protein [Streptomyces agglomeratus]|uniref:DUF305 domain-containing protein n=1 Tax=Streptomyces agglomeratus TaxID=285458 RepID=A0A1E5PC90_9ACTN|nr:DUF305 domain-containing protein [Streptomyces agglomeratus]OEJ27148.1 DUF305 domain-containing protein [Streptomyces agglomeratus]OEJ38802.1 DUF305 domain-containing protein [Streptomyces agglomeratus]OEJ46814.1 DUF305 domain-containing protein [Streptomyces agglomeratus]OEJ51331.1 DUF305 domain-containing protein [Streptomyces agglomeratus]